MRRKLSQPFSSGKRRSERHGTINLVCFRVDGHSSDTIERMSSYLRGRMESILVPSAFFRKASAWTNIYTRTKLRQTKRRTDGWTRRYIRIICGQLIMNLTLSAVPLLLPYIGGFTAVFFHRKYHCTIINVSRSMIKQEYDSL